MTIMTILIGCADYIAALKSALAMSWLRYWLRLWLYDGASICWPICSIATAQTAFIRGNAEKAAKFTGIYKRWHMMSHNVARRQGQYMLYCMLSKKDESIRPSLVLFFYLSPREEGRIVKDTMNDNHLYRRFLLSTAPANMLVLFCLQRANFCFS